MKYISLIFLSLAFTPSHGKEYLPESVMQDNNQYQRCDHYTLRYGFVIKVAEIGWYALECKEKSLLETNTKILRFHYFKDVEADFFKESAEEYFMLNLSTETQQVDLLQPLKEFNSGYTDIQAGEYFQLFHDNENKLSLYRNDNLLATTQNRDLAKKYFNIWFGDTPVIEKLKRAFL